MTAGTVLTPILARAAAGAFTGSCASIVGAAGVRASTCTNAVPLRIMSSRLAAEYDRSMIRLLTNGPRSLIRTTTL